MSELLNEEDVIIPKESTEVKLAMRIADLEAERDRWAAAFNNERIVCFRLQTERDKLRKGIKEYLDCQTTNQWVTHFKEVLG